MKKSVFMKRLICFSLIALFLLQFAACTKTPDAGTDSSDGTTTSEDTRPVVSRFGTVPESVDYGGREITILSRADARFKNEIYVEAQTDNVSTEIFKRNRAVEEYLGVKLNVVTEATSWGERTKFFSKIENSYMTGECEFDIVSAHAAAQIAPLSTRDLCVNLLDAESVPYLDLSQPYWPRDFVDEISVNGKLYVITGDLALSLIQNLFVIYYNEAVAATNGIEGLYDLVLEGKWTLDKLNELTNGLWKDLNNDGLRDPEDAFGFITTLGNSVDAYWLASNCPVTVKNDKGVPELAIKTVRSIQMFDKVYSLLVENSNVLSLAEDETGWATIAKIFTSDRSLFYAGFLSNAEGFVKMDSDYGILPYPKLNDEQESYRVMAQDGFSIFGIINNTKNIEASSAVLEAMCAHSYSTVVPAYYEIALKYRYTRNSSEVTSKIIDIIHESTSFNFGILYGADALNNNAQHKMRSMMLQKSRTACLTGNK